MTRTKFAILIGLLLAFLTFAAAPAHAQYVGGQPPPAGPTDQGPQTGPPTGTNGGPTQVQGVTFTKHHSGGGFLGLSWADGASIVGGVAALSLLWLFFVWKRRHDDEDEGEFSGAAPA